MFGRRTTTSAPDAAAQPATQTHMIPDDGPLELEQLWAPPPANAAGGAGGAGGLPAIPNATAAGTRSRKSVEQLLMERGQINEEQLEQARHIQSQTPSKSISQILLTMNAATEAQILSAVAETLGMAFETPERAAIDPNAFNLLQPDYMRQRNVLPLRFDEGVLILAVTDPNNVFLLDEVKHKLRREIR